tara:strand:+ start:222 stop:365 length:144 start_codon:yes stop_codon:yes gene_type:complete
MDKIISGIAGPVNKAIGSNKKEILTKEKDMLLADLYRLVKFNFFLCI